MTEGQISSSSDTTIQLPEPGKLYTISTEAGGKDYSEELIEYISTKYRNINITHVHRGTEERDSTKTLSPDQRNLDEKKNKEARSNNLVSVLIVKNTDVQLFENVFQRVKSANTDNSENLPLGVGLRLLGQSDVKDELLVVIYNKEPGSITCAGSERILVLVEAYRRQYKKEIFPEQSTVDNTGCQKPQESQETYRSLLSKETAECILDNAEGLVSIGRVVLEGCVNKSLQQCQNWLVSLLVDVAAVSPSQQYVQDITDHVMDYLTQCFRQKLAVLELQNVMDQDTPKRQKHSSAHIAVLQKLSPTLNREINLEGTNLLDYMYQQDALSETERQSILAQPTQKRKNEAFIDHLCANYSIEKFKEVVLPILHEDESNQVLAKAIERELQKQDMTSIESKCTFCKVKGLIDLRSLSEHLLSTNSISQALRRDLCNQSISSSDKWKELLGEVGEDVFLEAVKKKYLHFHNEFKETGDSPVQCCCNEIIDSVEEKVDITTRDVANLDDLLSEIGSRTSFDVRNSVTEGKSSPFLDSVWKTSATPAGYRKICGICQQMIRDTRILSCCHVFCKVCICSIHRLVKSCPVCGRKSAAIRGTMPNGSMTHRIDNHGLPGFEEYETIVITYHIKDGIQTDVHPCSGQAFKGISCTAYLPNSLEGQIVLMLLQAAWDRGLTFTLKQSVSSNLHYVLTWNNISHKTNRTGGPGCLGYPDQGYLRRVKKDLFEQGVHEEDLRSTMV